MSIFNEYPYTNFHELNLDWLLKKIKELAEEWTTFETQFQTLQDAFDDLKAYVDNYFDELDVQEEVNNAVDELVNNGTFDTILAGKVNNPVFNFNPNITGRTAVRKEIAAGMNSAQGFCVLNGAFYLGYSSPGNGSNGMLQKYNPDNGVMGTLTGSYYHLESICSDGTNIYSLDCLEGVDPSVTYVNSISVFTANPFAYVRKIIVDMTGIAGVITGLMYNSVHGLMIMTSAREIYAVDAAGVPSYITTLNGELTTIQQTCATDNYIFVCGAYPNVIQVFDFTGKNINCYNIGNVIENASTFIELEGVYIENDIMYIRGITPGNRDVIVECPLNSPVINATHIYNTLTVTTIYVDGLENTAARIANNHFKTIQDAIDYTAAYNSGKYIINCSIDSSEDVIIDKANVYYRIDAARFSGTITLRAGSLTLNVDTLVCTGHDVFINMSNSVNSPCSLFILKGTVSGVAGTYFLQTYGYCVVGLYMTGGDLATNTVLLDRLAKAFVGANIGIRKNFGSEISAKGILNYVTGYAGGFGDCDAVTVDMTLTTSEQQIPLPDITLAYNVSIDIRTGNGCKGTYYLALSTSMLQPFWVTVGGSTVVYYIKLRLDSGKVYASLVSDPGATIKLNLVLLH